jgi:2-dehydropantoate 2-reductase
MQHVVFGAGLIGGYLAGSMINSGLKVSLVARPSVQTKLSAGLVLTDYQDHHANIDLVPFIAESTLREAPASHACDYLWLTVKCTDVDSSLTDLPALVGPNTVIFCVQNGLGSEQSVKAKFPNNKVMRAMVVFNVAEPKIGHLHRGSEGNLSIEELADYPAIARAIATQLNSPLLPAQSCDHMQALLWAKLQLNLANAVNALADIPVKKMIEDRDFRRVMTLLMRELIAVTKAKNIDMPKVAAVPAPVIPIILSLPNFIFKLIAQKMLAVDPTVRASMWWDLSAGKLTEIDYLNAVVVAEGEALGVACPANKKLVAMVHRAEQGDLAQGISGRDLLTALTSA